MPNLFQSGITPLKPNVLSTERIYVYVPEATYTTKGIASFEENEFAMNDGHVQLNTDYLSASPFTRPSLIRLNNEDFVFEDGITSLNWTKLRNFADARIHLVTDPLTGRVEVLERGLAQEIIDRGNADTALGRRIDDEITNRENADIALGGRIDDEITNRENADTALGGRIDDEIFDRKAADIALDRRIDDEITNRQNADTALGNRITTIEGLIPDDATTSNKLVTVNTVNDAINMVTAYYITKNAAGDPFGTKDELLAATVFYSGGQIRVPTRNDYCYVQADVSKGISVGTFDTTSKYIGYWVIYNNEGIEVTNANKDNVGIVPGTTIAYSNIPTTRYSYQGNQWEFQVIVNESPLNIAQLAAINSGITKEKVLSYDTMVYALTNLVLPNLFRDITTVGGAATLRITDVETSGAYKINEGTVKIYYNGESGTEYLEVSPSFIFVSKNVGNWTWYAIVVSNNSITAYYGTTTVSSGSYLKETKPTDESYTIASNSWTALSSSDPYTYSATVTATYTIGNDTEVGIVPDQPVLFANYGFVVGAVSGQNVTIYALEQPSASVTLTVSYRG